MKDHELPTADAILFKADFELGVAYRALGDAADWLRSDWQPVGTSLTAEQSDQRDRMWTAIETAKTAINKARRR